MILFFVARHAALSRHLVEIVALMGAAGFGCTIGVHGAVGYTDFLHVLPAFLGLFAFLGSLAALARAYFVTIPDNP